MSLCDAFAKLADTRCFRYIICGISVALCVMFICQNSLPSFMHISSGDWSVISAVGRRMAEGELLYVDVWEQKGPLLYVFWAFAWFVMRTYSGVAAFELVGTWVVMTCTVCVLSDVLVERGAKRRFIWFLLSIPLSFAMFYFVSMCDLVVAETYFLPFLACGVRALNRMMMKTKQSLFDWVVCGLGVAVGVFIKYPMILLMLGVWLSMVWLQRSSKYDCKCDGFWKLSIVSMCVALVFVACGCACLIAYGCWNGFLSNYFGNNTSGYGAFEESVGYFLVFMVGMGAAAAPVRFLCMIYVWSKVVRCDSKRCGAWLPIAVTFTFYWLLRAWIVYAIPFAVFLPFVVSDFKLPKFVKSNSLTRLIIGVILVLWAVLGCLPLMFMNTLQDKEEMYQMEAVVREADGGNNSVLVTNFGELWLYDALGLESSAEMPAMTNMYLSRMDDMLIQQIKDEQWKVVIMSVEDMPSRAYRINDALKQGGYEQVWESERNNGVVFVSNSEPSFRQNDMPDEFGGDWHEWQYMS